MTPQTALEVKGTFFAHPFAEMIAEIAAARLNGSLRLSNKDKKCVVYFKNGGIVFAVSNARSSRLFAMLMTRGKITKDDLAQVPSFANDIELAAFLQDKNFLTKLECDRLFTEQIEAIIVDALSWIDGEWAFSSLARVRDGLSFNVGTTQLIVDYGRCLPVDKMLRRFRSLDESFGRSAVSGIDTPLTPDEAFVLSRADEGALTAANLVTVAAMQESTALQAIYTLWLAGLLVREDWQSAFSGEAIAAIRGARLELKREAKLPMTAAEKEAEKVGLAPQEIIKKAPEVEISLEDYLERVENAETHYDILGVDTKAEMDELKRAYFSLARNFHPDRYHATGGDMLRRVQNAFTELTRAHETLKTPESRDVYDYRMRKEIANREKRRAAGDAGNASYQLEQAAENFERAFSLLMDNEHENSLPFFARAVHYAPNNARYHAYFGKALSADEIQRHKAESEMQAAIKLDPTNPLFRILLAEFFIQNKLKKRAEGELTRLLNIFPSNREARDMLETLK